MEASGRMVRVGIDIGGTFTDLVALDASGTMQRIKIASTPRRPELGFLAALDALLETIGAAEIVLVAHASTIATNALLGQMHLALPRVAFVTTAGFATCSKSAAKTAAPSTISASRGPCPRTTRGPARRSRATDPRWFGACGSRRG